MATAKQIAANKANAEKSCGPKSPETKAKVSQNGVQHGLCGKFRVLAEVEHQEDFDALLNQLIADEQPVGQGEIELVVKMAEHTWLAKRALRLQDQCFTLEPKTPEDLETGEIPVGVDPRLERYVRYHAAQDRAYQRASAELQKRKEKRRLAEIGFARQEREEAAENRKIEKHATDLATKNMRKQREELRLANDLAKVLRPLPPFSGQKGGADDQFLACASFRS
jgi:hypothetical protein